MLILGHDQAIAHWVGTRVSPTISDFGPCRAIGVARDDRIIAGVVYANYRMDAIEATIAAEDPRWCRRGVLRGLFHYPFRQLGCRRITCIISADNERSLRLCQGLGFTIEGRCREVFGPVDGIICGLLKRDCRWIEQ